MNCVFIKAKNTAEKYKKKKIYLFYQELAKLDFATFWLW
jgi:hypothetical protein